MIFSWNNFLQNKINYNLLLEGKMICSDGFLNKLRRIDNNPVANALYRIFSNNNFVDSDLRYNFIDETEESEMISYLTDKRSKLIKNVWTSQQRSPMRIGRFARALLSDEKVLSDCGIEDLSIKDEDYERFVNLYKSLHEESGRKFVLVDGEDIRKYYSVENYSFSGPQGDLGKSCMKYRKCSYFMDIYVKNPNVCKMLVYLDEMGKVLGRALVWKLNKKIDGCDAEYFMDRTYCHHDSDVPRFLGYAESKGWATKYKQSSTEEEGVFFKHFEKIFISTISVKLDDVSMTNYPFVDTLSYLSEDNELWNINFKGCLELTETDGDHYVSYVKDNQEMAFQKILRSIIRYGDVVDLERLNMVKKLLQEI